MSANKYFVYFLPEAELELDSIYNYFLLHFRSPKAVNNLASEVEDAIRVMKKDPFIYPISIIEGYRVCLVKNYIMFFRVLEEEKEVQIVHVFHGSQDYVSYFWEQFTWKPLYKFLVI